MGGELEVKNTGSDDYGDYGWDLEITQLNGI